MSLNLIKETWAEITVCSPHNTDVHKPMGKTVAAQRILKGERPETLK